MAHVGPYEVVGELGRGAMGTVLRARARHLDPGRDVALKVLQARDPRVLARFERERDVLTKLGEAEGFVPLLDAGYDPAHGPYLVMPLVGGGTLRDRLKRGPLPLPEVIRLGLHLAETLGRAHAAGVVHRDVKPENILFTADGRPLLADLGLAKFLDESRQDGLSGTGELRGTLGYMAPEQQRDAKHAEPAADVFSLGAILHECIGGRPAFLGETPLGLLETIAAGRRTRLDEPAPPWLARIIDRCLAVDPAARFPDGAAVAAALVSREDAPAGRSVPWVAVVGALGLVVALVVLFVVRPTTAPPAPVAPTEEQGDDVAVGPDVGAPPPSEPVTEERSPPPTADTAPPTPRAEAERLVASARRHERRRDYAAVEADCTRAIEVDPTLADAYFERSVARDHLGRPQDALKDATRAIELDPRLVGGWSSRGAIRQRSGDAAGALEDLSQAVVLMPTAPALWTNRAAARIALDQDQAAIDDAERALELDPKFARAYSMRGAARLNLGQLDRAHADASRALELDPTLTDSWNNRCLIALRRGDARAAEQDATKLLELAPQSANGWLRRAQARAALGDLTGAVADYDRALATKPLRPYLFKDRGLVKEQLGDRAGARADLEEALRRLPNAKWAPEVRAKLEQLR